MRASDNRGANHDEAEACGRCAMTSVVDMTEAAENDYDPFTGGHIEIDESELRAVSRHVVALRTVKEQLNEWAEMVVYDR